MGFDDGAQAADEGEVAEENFGGLGGGAEAGDFGGFADGALADVGAVEVEFVDGAFEFEGRGGGVLDADGAEKGGFEEGGFAEREVDEGDVDGGGGFDCLAGGKEGGAEGEEAGFEFHGRDWFCWNMGRREGS